MNEKHIRQINLIADFLWAISIIVEAWFVILISQQLSPLFGFGWSVFFFGLNILVWIVSR